MSSEKSDGFFKKEWSDMKEGLRNGPLLVRAFYLLMIYMVTMILIIGFLFDIDSEATRIVANVLITIFAIWGFSILGLLIWFRILRKEDKWGLLPDDDLYKKKEDS